MGTKQAKKYHNYDESNQLMGDTMLYPIGALEIPEDLIESYKELNKKLEETIERIHIKQEKRKKLKKVEK